MKSTSLIDARSLNMVIITNKLSGVKGAYCTLTEEKAFEHKPLETLLVLSLYFDLLTLDSNFLLRFGGSPKK